LFNGRAVVGWILGISQSLHKFGYYQAWNPSGEWMNLPSLPIESRKGRAAETDAMCEVEKL
jgi:hypothetical protein